GHQVTDTDGATVRSTYCSVHRHTACHFLQRIAPATRIIYLRDSSRGPISSPRNRFRATASRAEAFREDLPRGAAARIPTRVGPLRCSQDRSRPRQLEASPSEISPPSPGADRATRGTGALESRCSARQG